jgi:8-oxo-dGTP diphosphatase
LTACAIRELVEETGLIANESDLKLNGVTNAVYDEETHYITVIYETNVYSGEVTIVEPDKCEEWNWFTFETLPEDLFLPFKNYVNAKSKI